MTATVETEKAPTRKQIHAMIGSKPLSQPEMRYLVEQYYAIQEYRKASSNQISAIERIGGEAAQLATTEIHKALTRIEKQIQTHLEVASNNSAVGRWCNSITGIGPVISAGLLAHIDIHKAPTAGHIWRFAGLDPTQNWLGAEKAKVAVKDAIHDGIREAIPSLARLIGTSPDTLLKLASSDSKGKALKLTETTLARAAAKRPWNAALKTLCWHIGESFVKVSGKDDDVYGKLYLIRKDYEQKRNESGALADQAAAKLDKYKIGKETDAYGYYSKGFLPPAHIHARAKRWTVKLFLAHWQWVAWESETGQPPALPYVIEHMGHMDLLAPPNWPMK
jgi:hypothetical protein